MATWTGWKKMNKYYLEHHTGATIAVYPADKICMLFIKGKPIDTFHSTKAAKEYFNESESR